MDTNVGDFDSLNAWQVAKWLGVSVEMAMELAWHGQIPAPRHADPLIWHVDDLNTWQSAGCPVRDVPHAGWKFRPLVYLSAKNEKGNDDG